MSFVPHTPQERAEMLAAVGVASLDDLFADIPPALRLQGLEMPDGLAEQEVYDHLHALSHRNTHDLTSFLGAGFYDHTIPAAVDSLVSRGEFFTAYTPYQPEVAQGTLQAVFEFQSMICRLTGLDAANASMYDGGTALAEAVLAAVHATDAVAGPFAGRGSAVVLGTGQVDLPAVLGALEERGYHGWIGLEPVDAADAETELADAIRHLHHL